MFEAEVGIAVYVWEFFKTLLVCSPQRGKKEWKTPRCPKIIVLFFLVWKV